MTVERSALGVFATNGLSLVLSLARSVLLVRTLGGGARPPHLDGVRFGYVVWRPEDEVRYFQEIDVGLYPLADTPWTRGTCGFTALQYMACGAVGVPEGIGRRSPTGRHADGPDAGVEARARALGDRDPRRSHGRPGRARVGVGNSVAVASPVPAPVLRHAAGRS